MPIDGAVLRTHIERVGRELYHVTSAQCVDPILDEGLRPGSEIGRVQRDDFFKTRPKHVYLLDIPAAPLVRVDGERALIQIDLCQLRGCAFDTDEDLAQDAALAGRPWVSIPPPTRQLDGEGREVDGQSGLLAAWADETEGFDNPEVAAKSLQGGRVAYRGTIPPDALAAVDVPSEGASRFRAAACEALGLPEDALPPPPSIAYCDLEVALARGLVDAIIDAALLHANVSRPNAPALHEPYAALQLGEELRNKARAMTKDGELDRAVVVRNASRIATTAEDLHDFGWPHHRTVFLTLAEIAAGTLTSVALLTDKHTAASVARTAADAMAQAV